MVHIVTKKINGHEYLYLVHNIKNNGKSVQKTIKYIGKKRFVSEDEFKCMKKSFEGKDWILKDFIDELSYKEHELMENASSSFAEYLGSISKTLKEKEKEKFLSIFIANSNAIEGSTMSVKDTHTLIFNDSIPKRISRKELNMAQNLFVAWNYIETNHKRFPAVKDLLKLHDLVEKNISPEDELGVLKKSQNYVGELHTTSYLFVEERLNELLKWIKKAQRLIDDFEVAFQSHAQFELIHPFPDGNGRVGRLLLNWLLMRKDKLPLAIQKKNRAEYLSALWTAQQGKLEAISKFCLKEYLKQYKSVV